MRFLSDFGWATLGFIAASVGLLTLLWLIGAALILSGHDFR